MLIILIIKVKTAKIISIALTITHLIGAGIVININIVFKAFILNIAVNPLLRNKFFVYVIKSLSFTEEL